MANNDNLFVLAKNRTDEIEDIQGSSLSFWKDAQVRFFQNRAAVISLIVIIIVFLIAVIGPISGGTYNIHDVDTNHAGAYTNNDFKNLPPRIAFTKGLDNETNAAYEAAGAQDYSFLFGTDANGRDVFVRVCLGTLVSIAFGMVAAAIDIFVGVSLGGISGYFGGKIDLLLQRIVEVLGTIPMLIWVMIFVIFFGAGFFPLVFAIVISGWIPMYRLVRGQVFKIKEQEFVLSSQTLGGGGVKIIFKHIIPNTIGTIIIWLMFTIPSAIFTESFLSYIGLGIQIPTPSLGSLVSDSKAVIEYQTYLFVLPTLTLATIMLSFNLIADGLRDAFDPRMRGGE